MRQISSPFTKIPDWILDADISLGAFKLYAVLASYTSSGNAAYPSLTTLAKRLDVSRMTVNKWKNELIDYGAISVVNRYHKNGDGKRSNEYMIHEQRQAPEPSETSAPSKPSFTSSPGDSEPRPSKPSYTTLVNPALPGVVNAALHRTRTTKNKNHLTNSEPDGSGSTSTNGETEVEQQAALDGLQPEPVEGEIVEATSSTENDDQPNAQTLVAEWLDNRTTRPPKRVIGQLSKEIKNLLSEGYEYELVRAAVGQWHQRDLHPATLPSVLDNVQNGQNALPGASAAERRLIAGQQRDEALKSRPGASTAPVDPFALEAQTITQRQIENGDTAA